MSGPPPASAERSPEPALALHNVAVGYGPCTVVSGVSFSVEPGDWLAVIGPNGAGKSTLLKAIVGLLDFDGTISIGGRPRPGARTRPRGLRPFGARRTKDPAPSPRFAPGQTENQSVGAAPPAAAAIGYVPQRPILPPGMTTAEYVLLGRTAHLGWFQSESRADRRRVVEVLERLELTAMADRPITELSGGESQRVTLARALAQEATVLVLDEPTSSLDLGHQVAVLEVVDELRREHDLAVVTAIHDLSVASRFADRLVLVADGGVPAVGPPDQVLTEPILSRYYGTTVSVMSGPDGGLVIVPLRSSPDRRTGHTANTGSEREQQL
jgi:iron complex transport system ATP-binding protein